MTSGNAADPPRLSYLAAAAMSTPTSAPSSCNESNAAAGVAAAAAAPAAAGRISRQQQAALDVDLQRGRAAGMHDDILAELRLMTPRTRADILSAAESELRAARRVQEEHDRRVAQEVHDRDVAAAMAATESSRRSRVDADARLARELAAADAAEARAAAAARAAAHRHADGASAGNAGSPAAVRAAGSAARLFPSMAAGGASAPPRFTSMASHLHDGGDEDDDFFDDADAAFDAYDDVVRGSRRPHATRGGAGRNVGNARRGGQSPPLGAATANGGRVPFEMAGMGFAPASAPATQQRRRPHHGGAHNAASAPRVSSTALTNAVNARTGGASGGPASANSSFAAAVAASARTAQRQQHQQRDWRSEYEAAVIQRHLQEREAAGWHGGVGGPAPPVNPRHAELMQHQRAMLGARDVDRMSFEGLMELCERNGDVPTGLSEFQLARALETVDIAALEQMRAATIGSSAFSGAGAGKSTHGDTPDVVELSPSRTTSAAPAAASGAPVFVVEDDVDDDEEEVLDVDDAARPSVASVASCAPQAALASATAANAAHEVPVDTQAAPDLTCGVCLMDLTQPSGLAPDDASAPMRIRLCGHTFHAACIKPWLLSQPRCPICRLEL